MKSGGVGAAALTKYQQAQPSLNMIQQDETFPSDHGLMPWSQVCPNIAINIQSLQRCFEMQNCSQDFRYGGTIQVVNNRQRCPATTNEALLSSTKLASQPKVKILQNCTEKKSHGVQHIDSRWKTA
jgi:hypothetical protein